MGRRAKGSSSRALLDVHALVEPNAELGSGVRVGPFSHVEDGARVGDRSTIAQNVLIEGGATLGSRVVVCAGAQILGGAEVGDEVYIGPNAVLANARFPSAVRKGDRQAPVLREGASIGANTTVLAGVLVGRGAVVGAGSVVTRHVPPHAIVAGNPARLQGYVGAIAKQKRADILRSDPAALPKLRVKGASLHRLTLVKDVRGNLTVGEIGAGLPFVPRRYFVVSDVPNTRVRGEHAHRKLKQYLVCLRGQCSVIVDDGVRREEIALDTPEVGLYVPPMVWAVQYRYSPDAVVLVLASAEYDARDYIRDYEDFLQAVKR